MDFLQKTGIMVKLEKHNKFLQELVDKNISLDSFQIHEIQEIIYLNKVIIQLLRYDKK